MSEGKSLSLTDSKNYTNISTKSFVFSEREFFLISEENHYLLWILSSFDGDPIIDVDPWSDASRRVLECFA